MTNTYLMMALIALLSMTTTAQFNSGSTGADGALDLATMSCPNPVVCGIQVPESGVLNFTTVNIPGNKELRFLPNSRNSPVIILAQGNVSIQGVIRISGALLTPGPGGYYGGQASGFGPGGGYTANNPDKNGKWFGPLNLSTMVGGSGGGGGGGCPFGSNLGGGGGGALMIASSGSIAFGASAGAAIIADGGNRQCSFDNGTGAGSGGAIRLMANAISGQATLSANGVNKGVIRLETPSGQVTWGGVAVPAAVVSTIGPVVLPDALPTLSIVSVAGYAVPSGAGQRFDTVDLLLPSQIVDPVPVGVSAANVPPGSQVTVGFVNSSPTGTSVPCNLTGTLASSSCTASVSNLIRTGVTYLLATVTFTPPGSLAKFNPPGPNQVAQIRLETALGSTSKFVFQDARGRTIDSARLSADFLRYFNK